MKHPSYTKGMLALSAIAVFLSVITIDDNAGLMTVVALLMLCGMLLLYSLYVRVKDFMTSPSDRLHSKDTSLKFMAILMGFFLVWGTILYLYVFHTIANSPTVRSQVGHDVEFNNIEYLLRSLICSLDMFMLDVDSNILDRLDGHTSLKALIALQAVISFSCTVAMLIGLVYSRINAYYRLTYKTKINNAHNHLYLFFGINTPSELLIRDIARKDPRAVAVIIDEANIDEDDCDEWNGIIGLITHKRKIFGTADMTGAAVAIASRQLSDIDKDITCRPDFDAFGYLGLTKIKKLILNLADTSRPQLHIFFMDENEERNILNITALAKDSTILYVAKNRDIQHRIYCHARYNGPNRIIQDVALKKKLNIKIIDSSHIAVEILKHNTKYHPVNVASISRENPTTVDESFNALIVGFGEVGRDAFRYLYEFGAFVDSKSTDDVAVRSPFSCTIIDKNLNNIEGAFRASMPGIFQKSDDCIKFMSIDYNNSIFYEQILDEKYIRKLNYVIISIGDNDEATALAVRIFNMAYRTGRDMSRLRILVRCTNDTKTEYIQKTADHYNHGYGNGTHNTPVIEIFGQPENTYTYDFVVNDLFVEMGKNFHENYRKLKGEGDTWDMRHCKLTQTPVPHIEKLRKLRRQESQDLANAFHAGTKITLLHHAMGREKKDWNMFFIRYFNPDNTVNVSGTRTKIHYPELDEKENTAILRLAMLEHIRWNAAHELLGYMKNDDKPECDEHAMKHNCLRPWSELDDESRKTEKTEWPCEYKNYDFAVVDTTIAMMRDNPRTFIQ